MGLRALVADLRHDLARAHALASDLNAQLPPSLRLATSRSGAPRGGQFGFAQAAARGIDAESAGDGALERADALGQALLQHAVESGPFDVLVLHSEETEPSQEDQQVWQSLAQALRASAVGLIDVLVVPAYETHTNWLGRLVPGLLDAELLRLLAPPARDAALLVELPQGQHLLPIEWLPARAQATRLDFDRLASVKGLADWLRANAQLHGNNHFVDPDLLVAEAWAAFEAGGKNRAFTLLDRALEVARDPLKHATILCHLQGMRIADLRFAEVAAESPPAAQLPAALRSFLVLAKGWGCVLEGRAAEGEAFLEQGEAAGAYAPQSPERLYLDNIRALARFRQGDIDGALRLECRIAEALASAERPSAPLECVNGLNLARVHTARGEHAMARAQYQRAFDTGRGVMTDADLFYSHVCFARCDEAAGDAALSGVEWLRAALYWLSYPGKDTVSRRIAAIVGGKRWVNPAEAAPAVSDAMAGALERLWPQVQPAVGLNVVRVRNATAVGAEATLYHSCGLTILPLPGDMSASPQEDSSCRLARAVVGALQTCFGGALWASATVIGLPFRPGFGAAATPAQALAECLRLGVRRAWLDGQPLDMPAPEAAALWVRLNPAVQHLEGDRDWLEVQFRRYRAPREVSAADAEIVLLAKADVPLAQLVQHVGGDTPTTLAHLRLLEAEGLIDLYLRDAP